MEPIKIQLYKNENKFRSETGREVRNNLESKTASVWLYVREEQLSIVTYYWNRIQTRPGKIWNSNQSYTLRRLKGGSYQVLHKNVQGRYKDVTNSNWLSSALDDCYGDHPRNMAYAYVVQFLGRTDDMPALPSAIYNHMIKVNYPFSLEVAAKYGRPTNVIVPPGTRGFWATDHRGAAQFLGGKKANKDVNKIVTWMILDTNRDFLIMGVKLMLSLIHPSNARELLTLLEGSTIRYCNYLPSADLPILRRILKNYGRKRILNMMKREFGEWIDYTLHDIVTIVFALERAGVNYSDALPDRPRTLAEIHNSIARTYRRMERGLTEEKLAESVPQEAYVLFDGVQLGDITVVSPKTRRDIVEWGDMMSNCIASYATRAVQQSILLLGFYRKGKLFANAEVYHREGGIFFVAQLRGKYNQPLSAADETVIASFIDSLKTR